VFAAALISVLLGASPDMVSAQSVVRAAALTLGDRVSFVIELTGPVGRAQEVQDAAAEAGTIVVDVGPVEASTEPLDIVAGPAVPLLGTVSLRPDARSNGQTFLRLRIHLREAARHVLRTAGNRVYIDFARQESARQVEPPAQSPLTYETLPADILRRARLRAQQPDVRGLLALIDEIRQIDERLGRQRPDVVGRVIDEVQRLLDEARALQLKKDGEQFQRGAR
jgi:hypothetical protein